MAKAMNYWRRIRWALGLWMVLPFPLVVSILKRWFRSVILRRSRGWFRKMLRLGGNINLLEYEGVPKSTDYDFQRWLWRNYPRPWQLDQMRSASIDCSPSLISLLMPVYDPDPIHLTDAIESVLAQACSNWELCIYLDGSQPLETCYLTRSYSKLSDQIKVKQGSERRHISFASNQALFFAEGEFVALLDQDDVLPPHALHYVSAFLASKPGTDFLYTDEANLDEDGCLCRPFFKPGWSPDYFLSIMYTCHLQVFRRSLVIKIDGFREGFEGSQDWDLVLRFVEQTEAIEHLENILYHWRMHPNSTAKEGSGAKPYAESSAIQAIKEAINRRGEPGYVSPEPDALGCYKIRYSLLSAARTSILIPFRDQPEVLERCLQSLKNTIKRDNVELVLIDNGSQLPKTNQLLKDWSKELGTRLRLIYINEPFNYSKLHNISVPQCTGDYLLFLNSDTEMLSDGWLSAMIEYAQKPRIGAVGSFMLYPDKNTIQHAGVILGPGGYASHSHHGLSTGKHDYFNRTRLTGNFLSLCAACLMCRKEVFQEVNGFDEYFSHNYNDVDFCLKLHDAAYDNVFLPHVSLIHHESLTRGAEASPADQNRFENEKQTLAQRWQHLIDNDPFYNIHLTRDFSDFRIRDPKFYPSLPSQQLH